MLPPIGLNPKRESMGRKSTISLPESPRRTREQAIGFSAIAEGLKYYVGNEARPLDPFEKYKDINQQLIQEKRDLLTFTPQELRTGQDLLVETNAGNFYTISKDGNVSEVKQPASGSGVEFVNVNFAKGNPLEPLNKNGNFYDSSKGLMNQIKSMRVVPKLARLANGGEITHFCPQLESTFLSLGQSVQVKTLNSDYILTKLPSGKIEVSKQTEDKVERLGTIADREGKISNVQAGTSGLLRYQSYRGQDYESIITSRILSISVLP